MSLPESALVMGMKELLVVSRLVELEFAEPRMESTSSSSDSELLVLVDSSSPSRLKSPPLIGGVKLTQGNCIRPIRWLLINRSVGAEWYLQVRKDVSAINNHRVRCGPTRGDSPDVVFN